MADLLRIQDQLSKTLDQYNKMIIQNSEDDNTWRQNLQQLIEYVEKLGGFVQYNKTVVKDADHLFSLIHKKKINRNTGRATNVIDPKYEMYIQRDLFVPLYKQLEQQLSEKSELFRDTGDKKLERQLDQLLEHLQFIRARVTTFSIALGSVVRFDENTKTIVKKIDRLTEKVENIQSDIKNELPEALVNVVNRYHDIYLKQLKEIKKDIVQLITKFNQNQQKIVQYMVEHQIPLYYSIYANKDDQQLSEEAEYNAYVLVYNLYSRVIEYVGEVKEITDIEINDNGDMTATVFGSKKGAYMQTIIAGGYNIQRRHYRILVHPFNLQ